MTRLSDEKITHLSHVLLKAVAGIQGLTFPRGQNNARLRILSLIVEGVKAEDVLGERIRQKITSGKRAIPEGSREWEILYRKYYDEEMSKINPPAAR